MIPDPEFTKSIADSEKKLFYENLVESQRKLIKEIRGEAIAAKTCVTQYSFQTLIISGAIFSATVAYLQKSLLANGTNGKSKLAESASGTQPYIELVGSSIDKNKLAESATAMQSYVELIDSSIVILIISLSTIFILITMCRIALHKYTVANGFYGYQMFIERSANYLFTSTEKLNNNDGNVISSEHEEALNLIVIASNWEQILYVFEVLKLKLFESIYNWPRRGFKERSTKDFFFNLFSFRFIRSYINPFLYKQIKPYNTPETSNNNALWYMLRDREISQNKAKYPAGTYLEYILDMLLIMQYLFLTLPFIPFLIAAKHIPIGGEGYPWRFYIAFFGICLFAPYIVFISHLHTVRRREIIENNLLSIYAQSVIWHISVIVHFRSNNHSIDKSVKTQSMFESDNSYHIKMIEEISDAIDKADKLNSYFNKEYKNNPGQNNSEKTISNGDDETEDEKKPQKLN
jgi:hypothetical protein